MSEVHSEATSTRPTLEKLGDIKRALGHIGKALEYYGNLPIDPESESQTDQVRQRINHALLECARQSAELANDMARVTGDSQPESVTKQALDEETLVEPPREDLVTRPEVEVAATSVTVQEAPMPPPPVRVTRKSTPSGPAVKKPRDREHYTSELHRAIVTVNRTPEMQRLAGETPVYAFIASDTTLVIGESEMRLEGDRLFLFNALMMKRKEIVTASELKALGFRPEGVSAASVARAFNGAMDSILTEINHMVDRDLIKKIGNGRGAKYAVDPFLELVDERFGRTMQRAATDYKPILKVQADPVIPSSASQPIESVVSLDISHSLDLQVGEVATQDVEVQPISTDDRETSLLKNTGQAQVGHDKGDLTAQGLNKVKGDKVEPSFANAARESTRKETPSSHQQEQKTLPRTPSEEQDGVPIRPEEQELLTFVRKFSQRNPRKKRGKSNRYASRGGNRHNQKPPSHEQLVAQMNAAEQAKRGD